MQSKRQLQSAELIRRNMGIVLQSEGSYIYGSEPLVTVTSVTISPDFSVAKIYVSVYNTNAKEAVVGLLEKNVHRIKQHLSHRIRKHIRRVPDIAFYLDETLDEVYRLNTLFDRLHDENQMGEDE